MGRAERRAAAARVRRGESVEVATSTYLAELVSALDARAIRALHVYILHHEGCSIAGCYCTPSYTVERLTTSSMIEAAQRQAAWIESTARGLA